MDMSVLSFACISLLLGVLVTGENSSEKDRDKIYFLEDPPQNSHHHHDARIFPPDFQHSPNFHRRIAVSNQEDKPVATDDSNIPSNTTMEIPLDYIQDLNNHDVSDLLQNFVDGDVDFKQEFLTSRFHDDGKDGARNAATIPKAAGCTPEMTTVELASSTDPSVIYIPQCTKIERCSGCCSHQLLACQPTVIEQIPYQVLKTQFIGPNMKLKPMEKEIVIVEKHIKCKCDCKVKKENCNKYQEYKKAQCKCVCTNYDDQEKCFRNRLKLWNPELCACQCRNTFNCTTGYEFNDRECECRPSISKTSSLNKRPYAKEDWN